MNTNQPEVFLALTTQENDNRSLLPMKYYEQGAHFKYIDLFTHLVDLVQILPASRLGNNGIFFQENDSNLKNRKETISKYSSKKKLITKHERNTTLSPLIKTYLLINKGISNEENSQLYFATKSKTVGDEIENKEINKSNNQMLLPELKMIRNKKNQVLILRNKGIQNLNQCQGQNKEEVNYPKIKYNQPRSLVNLMTLSMKKGKGKKSVL